MTCLCWDASGISFVLADADGHVEFWSSNQYLVSSWRCILRKTVPGETFIAAKFVQSAKQVSHAIVAASTSAIAAGVIENEFLLDLPECGET